MKKKATAKVNRIAKRRRNPELERAAALTERFHQRPAHKVITTRRVDRYRGTLTDLGALVDLVVEIRRGYRRTLVAKPGVRVASSPDGRQIYFDGGDQEIDMAALGVARLQRDSMVIGDIVSIAYRTGKGMDNFDESRPYEHNFGEDGGTRPVLLYDALNKRISIAGGTYRVEARGIVN